MRLHEQKIMTPIKTKSFRKWLSAISRSAPPATKEPTMSLSFQELHQLTRAAVTRAEELQVPVVISIVDANGTQTVTWRMPDALLVSSELAPKKAWTAVAMKTATHELTSAVQPGPRFTVWKAICRKSRHLRWRVRIWREGLLLGGLGISGGSVEQDMDIAETAIAAINVRTHQ
jgi:uncharacterized protein GlcG (DUF336 family)